MAGLGVGPVRESNADFVAETRNWWGEIAGPDEPGIPVKSIVHKWHGAVLTEPLDLLGGPRPIVAPSSRSDAVLCLFVK